MNNKYNLLGIISLWACLGASAQQSTTAESPATSKQQNAPTISGSAKASKSTSKSGDNDDDCNCPSASYGSGYSNQNYSLSDWNKSNNIEKRRVINKSYGLQTSDKLVINNQFGDVKVELWDKREAKIEITIIGRASSEKKAQEMADAVEIIERQENGKIYLRTEYDYDNGWMSWGGWSRNTCNNCDDKEKTEEKRAMEINYVVTMPKTNALAVSNKYGKILISSFSAPLKITSNYGSFVADRITGTDKDIFVSYGSAIIKQIETADMKLSYSKMSLDKADNLRLKDSYSKISIIEADNLDAHFQYTSGKIGKLNQSGKISITYANNLQLPVLSKTLKNLELKSDYTPIRIPVTDEDNFDFDVSVNYSSFRFPNSKVVFSENPDKRSYDDDGEEDRQPSRYSSSKVYKGRFGKTANTPTRIVIKSNFAPVKFVEKTTE
jgi:hypothetical protein